MVFDAVLKVKGGFEVAGWRGALQGLVFPTLTEDSLEGVVLVLLDVTVEGYVVEEVVSQVPVL